MNPSQKRPRCFIDNPSTKMYDISQSKKARKAQIDISQLSPIDQEALERVARLLNKPISELCDNVSNSDNLVSSTPRTITATHLPRTRNATHTDYPTWVDPCVQREDANSLQPTGSGVDIDDFGPQNQPRQWHRFPDFTRTEEAQLGPELSVSLNSQVQFGHERYDNGFGSFHDSELDHTGSWLEWGSNNEVFPWSSIQTQFQVNDLGQGNFSFNGRPGTNPPAANTTGALASSNSLDFSSSDGPRDSDDSIAQHFDADSWEHIQPPKVSSSESQLASSAETTRSGWSMLEVSPPYDSYEKAPGTLNSDSYQWISADQDPKESRYRPQRRGPFQDKQLQQETSDTRKLKACVRCRMQKIRCHIDSDYPGGICKTCKAVSKQKLHRLDCLRYKITECTLFRVGKAPGMEFTFRWPVMKLHKDISNWAAKDIRTISIKSDVCPVPLQLSVRRFVPIPEDSLHKGWMDGKIKKWKEVTPFAIVNMSKAAKDMCEYINAHVFQCMDFFLRGRDDLVRETYTFARKYMPRAPDEEKALLGNFFRLWFAIRRTATVEHIVSEDTLDMEPELSDRSYPLFEKIPLPPVMIQQLDMILTVGLLDRLRKKVLEGLQRMIINNKPKSWMTIYLVTFMFLHSCAALSAENYFSARKHGLVRRYAMPKFISELHHGANVFLVYYHYCTKRCNPFTIDWKKRQCTPFSEISTEEIHFLIRTSRLMKERKDKFRDNNQSNLYEDDLYFVSQMYEENWMPKDTVIDYNDGTIYDGPLQHYYKAEQ